MGTTTTNYSLTKPTVSTDVDWGADINTNWDTIDTTLAANAALIALNTTHAADNSQAHSDYFLNTTDSFAGTATFNNTGNALCMTIVNAGTESGLYINQTGVLAASKYALWAYSNVAQTTGSFVRINLDHASSTAVAFSVDNDGTGTAVLVSADGVLASDRHALSVYSDAIQVTEELVKFHLDNASSDKSVLQVVNDGTGVSGYFQQNGNGAGIQVENAGTSHGILVLQKEVLTTNKHALEVQSDVAQVTEELVKFHQDHASSSAGVVKIYADGTGPALEIQNITGGTAFTINNNTTTGHGISLSQTGVMAGGIYGLRVYSDAIQVTEELVHFHLDNASSSKAVVEIIQDGTGSAIEATGAIVMTEVDNGNSGATDTIVWSKGNKQKSTLTDNVTYTFTNPAAPCSLILKVIQDAGGTNTVTWDGDVQWASGSAPTVTATGDAVDIVAFYFDGSKYYGSIIQDVS